MKLKKSHQQSTKKNIIPCVRKLKKISFTDFHFTNLGYHMIFKPTISPPKMFGVQTLGLILHRHIAIINIGQ